MGLFGNETRDDHQSGRQIGKGEEEMQLSHILTSC